MFEVEKFKQMEDQVQSLKQKQKEKEEIVKNKDDLIVALRSEINNLNKQIEKYQNTFSKFRKIIFCKSSYR